MIVSYDSFKEMKRIHKIKTLLKKGCFSQKTVFQWTHIED